MTVLFLPSLLAIALIGLVELRAALSKHSDL